MLSVPAELATTLWPAVMFRLPLEVTGALITTSPETEVRPTVVIAELMVMVPKDCRPNAPEESTPARLIELTLNNVMPAPVS